MLYSLSRKKKKKNSTLPILLFTNIIIYFNIYEISINFIKYKYNFTNVYNMLNF